MVFRMLGSRGDTEDALQEIMMKLWVKRATLKNHPNIRGFVFLTARNYCLDVLKKKKLTIAKDYKLHAIAGGDQVTDDLEGKQLEAIIIGILEDLPQNQREVLLMRDFDAYEYEEIASALQLKVTHVRVLLSRARIKVRNVLVTTYGYGKVGYE